MVAALAAEGAAVAAVDLDRVRVAAVAAEHQAHGRPVRPYPADVSHADAVDRVVTRVEDDLGPIDILVNVAGVLRPGPVLKSTDEDWLGTFAVNSDGVFFFSRAVARRMVPRAAGVIVTVGSNAVGVPRMDMAAYAASKAAATMFTRCLGLELAQHGIRCNVVSPGSTDTAMQRSLWTGDGARRVIEGSPESYRVGIPLGRIAESADIADAVLFLASEQARHITMQNLYVDGGATLVG
ncbi:2,3-dihydro-2,3-dihydroxybenzoate dehydrogenase [Actinokineospora diospyrosa]